MSTPRFALLCVLGAVLSIVLALLLALAIFKPTTSEMRCQTAQISEHMSETRCIQKDQ